MTCVHCGNPHKHRTCLDCCEECKSYFSSDCTCWCHGSILEDSVEDIRQGRTRDMQEAIDELTQENQDWGNYGDA